MPGSNQLVDYLPSGFPLKNVMPKDITLKASCKKFSLKKLWKKLRSIKKIPSADDRNLGQVDGYLPSCSSIAEPKGADPIKRVGDGLEMDIHEVDKDRIRTCCKEALDNPPEFPSREEVKERIENAHKYYGIKCMYNHYARSEDSDDKRELQPSWYYILERPLVEQYVLMTNYIRKLSVMASLKCEQSGVAEEPAIEEEVSSISSCSDYADFATDSHIAEKLKESRKLSLNQLPSPAGITGLEKELRELKYDTRSEERTIKANEYTIVIREPARKYDKVEEVLPSGSNAIELGKIEGDHLPDMADFDLSFNLVSGPVESRKRGVRQASFYHWLGNSTPTKTPLLNMDCQPPVRPRAPGTARDFLSFRNLSLSSEFVDSCRDFSLAFAEECRSAYLKEIEGPGDSDEDYVSFASQKDQLIRKPVLSLTWRDTQMDYNTSLTASSATDQAERDSIIERAALASDYIRECMAQGVMCGENSAVSDETVLPDNVPTPFQNGVLRTSALQMDLFSDFVESESASSVETQISARPTNLN